MAFAINRVNSKPDAPTINPAMTSNGLYKLKRLKGY